MTQAEDGVAIVDARVGETEGVYQTKITFQDVTAGHMRISLDMNQFEQPMTISLQSMGILSAILLALALALSLRMGRNITTPLLQVVQIERKEKFRLQNPSQKNA